MLATKRPCLNQSSCAYKDTDYEVLFVSDIHERAYEFRRCNRCGLIYHYPESEEAELKERYTNYGKYSDSNYMSEQMKEAKKRNQAKARQLHRYLDIEKPKLLEVGCSSGVLLIHLMDFGYDCFGVEVDPFSSSVAKEYLGKDRVHTGFLGDSPFLDESFDLVICRQTIEHVPNPFELLLQMNRALKVNGVLYLDTPNFGGPSFRLLKDKWKNVLPGDHVSMFTPEVLEHFIEEAGFNVLKRRSGSFSYNCRRNAEGGYRVYDNGLMRMVFRIMGFALGTFNFGDGISAVARKEKEPEG